MPNWGPIGEQVFNRTYAREKEDGTKETFDEVVKRMVDGNIALGPHQDESERRELIELITAHKLVPAGRHWWVSGVPGRQFLFNCHRAGWTDQLSDHVGFLFDELMKGGGVGANYSSDYMERMHRVRRRVDVAFHVYSRHPDRDEMQDLLHRASDVRATVWDRAVSMHTITVDDSREGWANTLMTVCRLAQLEGPDAVVEIDLSQVRPRGSKINGFGGVASGPAPLARMIDAVCRVMNGSVGRRLTGLECMEIDHEIATCVVAGNVRRSARMSMMHWRDPDISKFIDLKKDGGHWTTNISVEVDDEFWRDVQEPFSVATTVLQKVSEGMHRNAEPGLFNVSLASKGERGDVRCTNPCGEIALEEWEQCNLGHVNLAKIEGMQEFARCATLMARWLLRATLAKGSSWRQWEVVQRNRRIGVGILGFQEWLWREFKCSYRQAGDSTAIQEYFQAVYYAIMRECDSYCKELGINVPIKLTTVAPTGTTAKISGVTEGIHPVFSRYFIRRVRFSDTDSYLQDVADETVHIEPDMNNPNTKVVSYVCRDAALDVVPSSALQQSDELTPLEMLKVQRMVQRGWADNAVSFTVNFDPTKYSVEYIYRVLKSIGPDLKGTTFMPEGSYEQAPLERITKQQYEEAAVKFVGSSADDCAGGACPIK